MVTTVKKKIRKFVNEGRVYVKSTYNNTIVTFTDNSGEILTWSSSGSAGFKGPRKSTPYAASVAATQAVEKAKIFGVEKVHAYVKGVGSGREQALRSIQANGISILSIQDITPIPHNGCRRKKARRV
ncbi:MAG: 30S ribosomal protein S11 [Candidatus Gracilibacteria bacterium]|nr:30S ribosomal protein S11 [Candidatus Gracilibacteria bacterium]